MDSKTATVRGNRSQAGINSVLNSYTAHGNIKGNHNMLRVIQNFNPVSLEPIERLLATLVEQNLRLTQQVELLTRHLLEK